MNLSFTTTPKVIAAIFAVLLAVLLFCTYKVNTNPSGFALTGVIFSIAALAVLVMASKIDVVLEGELHIRSEGKTVIGKAGDVIFIPRGSSIEFGTPGKVRFIYVTYPADWQSA